MRAAVFHIIGFAGIVIGVKAGLTCADTACTIFTSAVCPACDFFATVSVVAAAMICIILFACVLENMEPSIARIEFARFIDACTRFPAFNLIGTFYPMLATMLGAVFFADDIMVVFIRFAVRGTAAAIKTCFGIFACNKTFAVLICAAVLF